MRAGRLREGERSVASPEAGFAARAEARTRVQAALFPCAPTRAALLRHGVSRYLLEAAGRQADSVRWAALAEGDAFSARREFEAHLFTPTDVRQKKDTLALGRPLTDPSKLNSKGLMS